VALSAGVAEKREDLDSPLRGCLETFGLKKSRNFGFPVFKIQLSTLKRWLDTLNFRLIHVFLQAHELPNG
jgi:hypothetical protein